MADVDNDQAALAKLEAEEKAARDKLEKLAAEAQKKRDELKAKSRESDLKMVRDKCEFHGFTATDLRGALKTKGGGKKTAARKTAARKTTARKTTTRRKKST